METLFTTEEKTPTTIEQPLLDNGEGLDPSDPMFEAILDIFRELIKWRDEASTAASEIKQAA
jgi:hypothetical protein